MNAKNIICFSLVITVLIAALILAILPDERGGADGVANAIGRAGGIAEAGQSASREATERVVGSIKRTNEIGRIIDTSIRENQTAADRITECQGIAGDIGSEIPGDIERIERCRDILHELQKIPEDGEN
jgi:hypothetical protein